MRETVQHRTREQRSFHTPGSRPPSPTHTTGICSRLPPELIELIVGFLWADLPALATCRLLCRAWSPAPLRHFPPQVAFLYPLRFRHRSAFNKFARLLASQKNRPYFHSRYRDFTSLVIEDDPMDQFGHSWTHQLPDYFVYWLRELELEAVDWTSTQPHPRFFQHLSHYTDLRSLTLRKCRFRNTSVVRTIINSLRRLSTITLWDITFNALRTPSLPTSSVITCPQLEIRLRTDGFWPVSSQSLLNLCLEYPQATCLDLDLRYFPSILHLQHFLLYCSKVVVLEFRNTFNSDPGLELQFGTGTNPTHPHPLSLSIKELRFHDMPAGCASQILQLSRPVKLPGRGGSFSHRPLPHAHLSILPRELNIGLVDRPSADDMRSVARSLRQYGSHLNRFEWWNREGNDLGAVPCTAANTFLTSLSIYFGLAPSRHTLQRSLLDVLSNITCPRLERLMIDIVLLRPTASRSRHDSEVLLTTIDTRDFTSAFCAVLSRSILTRVSNWSIRMHMTDSRSDVKSDMVNLFKPWTDRGTVLYVDYGLSWKFSGGVDIAERTVAE
ncbi:uncharacterized protein C8Q71DRAFT_287868 [Rhodofomes roseus]|uniref:F-box domain-containing protein n=1 Tax=Rhodofomes roseus TaxID=34475 RepID=A0ABQ8K4L6_9APHY|nr:uncharacterized protein C8Q71DRAFT_287868 [Rhodofomes roseus]KAH9831860.1 hypothetical protein C8Q71DRAFT_287868 [Rhodofomes roseus]